MDNIEAIKITNKLNFNSEFSEWLKVNCLEPKGFPKNDPHYKNIVTGERYSAIYVLNGYSEYMKNKK